MISKCLLYHFPFCFTYDEFVSTILDGLFVERSGGAAVQGIAAITANNGWAMALAGVSIVISGLAVLATVISQLHKIIAFFESKGRRAPVAEPVLAPPNIEIDIFGDLLAAARIYQSITLDLGESFSLSTLYRVFEKEKVPHPHITIKAFREAGFLMPVGDGKFTWKNL